MNEAALFGLEEAKDAVEAWEWQRRSSQPVQH